MSRCLPSFPSRRANFILTGVLLLLANACLASTNLSIWVYSGASGRLLYQPDDSSGH